ncbi:MAG: hypothetical protein WCK91_01735 [bacterium]
MKFKDLDIKPLENRSETNPETEAEIVRQLKPFFESKIKEILLNVPENTDRKQFIIKQITASREVWFTGMEDLLDIILAKIESTPYTTDSEFEVNITHEVVNIFAKYMTVHNISLEEARRKFRLTTIEQNKDIPLDKDGITYCSLYEDIAEVHITKGLIATTWTEAVSNLLEIVSRDEKIKFIKMKSWVVADKLSFFRGLGFNVNIITDEKELAIIQANLDESMREKADAPWAEATMSREDFLNSKIVKRISK